MPLTLKQEQFDKQLDLTQMRQFRKTGDIDLLKQLYTKYIPLVYGIGLKYLHDRLKSKELLRKVFDQLSIEAAKYEISHLKNWLYITAKSACSTFSNETGENEELKEAVTPLDSKMMHELELHPLDKVGALSASVKNCIQRLDELQRTCIEQFYFKHHTYSEIAASLSCDEQDVKLHIKKGKQHITNCLRAGNE